MLSPASTRERLLVAAIEQFAERGYRDTSLASIGAAAEVSGPNLYGYFDSKADLLRSVHERGLHALWLNLDSALQGADTATEALGRLVAGHVAHARTWARVHSDLAGDPELRDLNHAHQREYLAEWVVLVRQAMPDLDFRVTRVRVLTALILVNDLSRTPHLTALSSFDVNLARIVESILTDPV